MHASLLLHPVVSVSPIYIYKTVVCDRVCVSTLSAVCVSWRRPPTCLWPDGSPKFVTIVLSVHQIVAPGIVEVTVLQKANQTQPLHNSTVKSLFSAPALIYFNPCRTTGAKRRTAVKRGRRLIFERQIMDSRL